MKLSIFSKPLSELTPEEIDRVYRQSEVEHDECMRNLVDEFNLKKDEITREYQQRIQAENLRFREIQNRLFELDRKLKQELGEPSE